MTVPAVLAQDVSRSAGKETPRKVTVGILEAFPPYHQLTDEGKPSGFAVDVMEEVAKRAGLRISYRAVETGGEQFRALREGDVDIIPSLGITEHRKQDFAFTAPVETFRISLFVREDTQDIRGLGDLAGRKVAVVASNAARRRLEHRDDIVLRVFPRFTDALFAVLSAEVDAMAYPEPVTWKLARAAGVADHIKIAGEPLFEIKRGMAVRKDDVALLRVLDGAVRDFVASPDYQRIYVTWFGEPVPYWTVSRVVLAAGVLFILTLTAMAGWHYRSVVQLNRELKETMAERRRAEKALEATEDRFKDFAEAASDWFWEMDENLRFTHFSARAYELSGVDPRKLIGKSRRELLAEGDNVIGGATTREDWDRHIADLEAHRPFQGFIHSRPALDGGHRYDSVSGKPIFDEAGNFKGYRGSTTNITEKKRAEIALRISEEQLRHHFERSEKASRAKSEFLANMSHELRTPLNAILGFSEVVATEAFGPVGNAKYLEYVNNIHGSGQHLLALINDLLDLSKVEAGEQELHEEDVDVPETIRACVVLIEERAGKGNVTVNLDIPARLPKLRADERNIKQIVVNLLSNAVKFTPDGGNVTIGASIDPGGEFLVQVADTGIGIAASDIPKALSPFGQVESKNKNDLEGTGLGLPLTKSLAELHGGSLDLQSEVGVGTTVTVRFPARRILPLSESASALADNDRAAS